MSKDPSLCRVDGCNRPVVAVFKGKEGVKCATHTLEALAQFFEMPCEGDTIQDIHRGEQLGAWLRGVKEDGE